MQTIFRYKLACITLLGLGVGSQSAVSHAYQNQRETPSRELVVLDTDIGDDIDDAFALGVLLNSPELKLLGITTEFGDTPLRARLAERYLKATEHDGIPVTAGIPEPTTNKFTQAAYANRTQNREYPDGVDFLLDQIRANPGKITLIAIGPLTNLGRAIERDKATFLKLKRVVIMGGSIYRGHDDWANGQTNRPPTAEWNIVHDIDAARALFSSGVPVYIMPLDSTQIHLSQEGLAGLFAHGSPLTDQISLLYLQWTGVQQWRNPALYDAVPVVYAVAPDLCPAKAMRVEVDNAGFTKAVDGPANVQLCLKSDNQKLGEFILRRLEKD